MADEGAADDLAGDIGGDEVPAKKSGGLKGALPVLLKYILIGISAFIFISNQQKCGIMTRKGEIELARIET